MLTRLDLKWNYATFSVLSNLNLIPVIFNGLTGQMENQKSVWKKIQFKLWQLLFLSQTIFMTIRTGRSAFFTGYQSVWDFTPIMVIFCTGYITTFSMFYTMFDSGRDLNMKVYNEILKIRGTFQNH
jgi:hypothetical protein